MAESDALLRIGVALWVVLMAALACVTTSIFAAMGIMVGAGAALVVHAARR